MLGIKFGNFLEADVFREANHKTNPGQDNLDLFCDLCKQSNELSEQGLG